VRRSFSRLILPALVLLAWSFSGLPVSAAEPPTPAHHARQSSEQHFTQANVAHDGHLTLDEAKGGYAVVAKHFDDIDADHKGYVTENDIRAWRVMKKAAHRLTRPTEDRLKPRNAMQLVPVGRVAVTAQQTASVRLVPPTGPVNN
jgi:hypothetical protein